MSKKQSHLKNILECLTAVTILFFLGAPVRAQSAPTQGNSAVRDNDSARMDREQFDRFMDSHREIGEQLRKDPSLANNKQFVDKHPALQTYLQEHPGIRGELKENPSAFMRQDDRLDRQDFGRDNDTTRKELTQFNQFLESHRETAEQLRKDPSLVNNREFLQKHPALQTYMQEHAGTREEIRENPNAFMRLDERYDRQEDSRDRDSGRRDNDATRNDNDTARRDNDAARSDKDTARRDNDATRNDNDTARRDNDATRSDKDTARRGNDATRNDNDTARRDNDATRSDRDTARRDNDGTRKDTARFDQFADSHREIAEQLRKDPSLVNNREFVDKHPALQAYMQEHPEMRDRMNENPNAFMRQDYRSDRDQDARNGYVSREHAASFGAFLGSHSSVAQDVSKNPALIKNDDYLRSHPELHQYLIANPGAQAEMAQNPENFVKSAQQFNNKANSNSNINTNGGGVKATAPPTDAKPKQ
jgi:hypothetical protein